MKNASGENQQTVDVSRGLEWRRKIFLSTPFYFVIYTVSFGVLQGFINGNGQRFSLVTAVATGISFGAIMALLTKRRQAKFNETTGVSDPRQQFAVHDVVRTGKLPRDPTLRRALPGYLEKRQKTNQQARKSSTIFLAVIGVGSFAEAAFDKDLLFGFIGAGLLVMAGLNYRLTGKQAKNIASLQAQLGQNKVHESA